MKNVGSDVKKDIKATKEKELMILEVSLWDSKKDSLNCEKN